MTRAHTAAALLLLALLAMATAADAQRFGFEPLEGVAITASASAVAVDPGQSGTLVFHVAYDGTAPLDATFLARETGGFGGGFRNGTRPSGAPRFNGTRPTSFPSGFQGGRNGRRTANITATADPIQATLQPGDEGDVTLTLAVAPSAAPGDHPMAFLVRSGNRTAMQAFTVHVNGSAPAAHASPGAGLGALVGILGVAAVRRRRTA